MNSSKIMSLLIIIMLGSYFSANAELTLEDKKKYAEIALNNLINDCDKEKNEENDSNFRNNKSIVIITMHAMNVTKAKELIDRYIDAVSKKSTETECYNCNVLSSSLTYYQSHCIEAIEAGNGNLTYHQIMQLQEANELINFIKKQNNK
ncbi:MAG TPA: hypothetical protein VLB80_01405 [Candidatus Babeliales bacterium]|nr:hypothetical protein [Candidatus Babeliales bacterium]